MNSLRQAPHWTGSGARRLLGRSGVTSRARGRAATSLIALLIPIATIAQQAGNPPASGTSVSQAKGDVAFGEYLSSLCVTCHLPSGKAVGGIPPIVAWPEDQFIAVINSYRWKDRDNEVMRTVTAQLTDEEIAALAAYFGRLTIQPEVK